MDPGRCEEQTRAALGWLLSETPPLAPTVEDLAMVIGTGREHAQELLRSIARQGLRTLSQRYGIPQARITSRVAAFVGDFGDPTPFA